MIENGLGFQLLPWQPLLDKRIGQQITGLLALFTFFVIRWFVGV